MKKPCAGITDAGFVNATGMSRLLAGRRNRCRVRAVRRGRSCVGRSNGEVVQAAFDRITGRKRRVVAAHRVRKGGTSRHTSGLVGPFGGAGLDRKVAEAFANGSTSAIARGTGVRAMGHRISHRGTRVIKAATHRVSGHIRVHACRKCSCSCGTACIVRILRIGARAVGLHVGAVFLGRGHLCPAARATSAGAGAAGAAFA